MILSLRPFAHYIPPTTQAIAARLSEKLEEQYADTRPAVMKAVHEEIQQHEHAYHDPMNEAVYIFLPVYSKMKTMGIEDSEIRQFLREVIVEAQC